MRCDELRVSLKLLFVELEVALSLVLYIKVSNLNDAFCDASEEGSFVVLVCFGGGERG
jgi:hypothetical protein